MDKRVRIKVVLTLLLGTLLIFGCGGNSTIIDGTSSLDNNNAGRFIFYPGSVQVDFEVINSDTNLGFITFENEVLFIDRSSAEGLKILNYEWDFGDGTKESGSDVTTALHKYAVPGSYTIKLTLKISSGADKVITKTIRAYDSGSSSGGSSSGGSSSGGSDSGSADISDSALRYTFDASTTFVGSDTVFTVITDVPPPFTWSFGDDIDETSSLITIAHPYEEPGLYNTSLVSYDDTNNSIYFFEVDLMITTLSEDITADFIIENSIGTTPEGHIQILPNTEIIFNDLSYPLGEAYWQFGDGTTAYNNSSGIKKNYHNYSISDVALNPLKVSLKEVNPDTFESNVLTKTIVLIEGVVEPDFEIESTQSGSDTFSEIIFVNSNVEFTNTSNIVGEVGDISFKWSSSDTGVADKFTEDTTYSFDTVGDYSIEYEIIQDANGADIAAAISKNIYVRENQENGFENGGSFDIYFSPTSTNVNEDTEFNSVININPDFPDTELPSVYHWIIKRKNTGEIVYNSGAIGSPAFTHSFATPGIYSVTLYAANDEVTSHKTQDLYIVSSQTNEITIDFTFEQEPYSVSNGIQSFIDNSNIGTYTVDKYLWDFGDGGGHIAAAGETTVSYEYQEPGVYEVEECIITTTSLMACNQKDLEIKDSESLNFKTKLKYPPKKSQRMLNGPSGSFSFEFSLFSGETVVNSPLGEILELTNIENDNTYQTVALTLSDGDYTGIGGFNSGNSGMISAEASVTLSTGQRLNHTEEFLVYEQDTDEYEVAIDLVEHNMPLVGRKVFMKAIDKKNKATTEWNWYITSSLGVETLVNTVDPNLEYVFDSSGTYTVSLEASTDDNFIDIETIEIDVYEQESSSLNVDIVVTSTIPAANIQSTGIGYVDVSGQFSGFRGYNLEGKIDGLQGKTVKEWRWFYGDGDSAVIENTIPTADSATISHTYPKGTYNIRLQVVDSDYRVAEKTIVFGINHTALAVVTAETYLANGVQNNPAVFDHDAVKCPVYPKMLPDKPELGKGDTILFQDVTEYSCGYSVHKRDWNRGRTGVQDSNPAYQNYRYTIEQTSGISTGLNFSVIDNAGGYYHIIYMFNLFNTYNTGIYRLDNNDKKVDVSPLGFYIPKQEVILRDTHPFITSSFIWTHGNDAYFSHQSDGAANPVNPVRTAFNHSGTFWAHAANNPTGDLADAQEIGGVSFTVDPAILFCSIGAESIIQDIGVRNMLGGYVRLPLGAAFSSQDCSPSNSREYLIYDSDSQSKQIKYDGSSTQNINTDLYTKVRMDDSEYTLVSMSGGNVNGHLNNLDVIAIVYHNRLQIYIIEVYDSVNNQIDFYYANSWDSIIQDDVTKLPYSISDVPSLHTGTNIQYKRKNMLVLDSGKVLVGLPSGTYTFDLERGLPPTIFEDLLLVEVIKAENQYYILNRTSSDHTFPTEILVNLKGESFALFLKEYDGINKGFGGLHYLR